MELPPNPTQIELRAWSNARQALGPERCEALAQSTNLQTRATRVIPSTTQGHWKDKSRSVNEEPPATRRGGSPTRGRKATPTHNPQSVTGRLPGDAQRETRTTPPLGVGPFRRMFNLFLSSDDPRIIIGSWIALALIVVTVLV